MSDVLQLYSGLLVSILLSLFPGSALTQDALLSAVLASVGALQAQLQPYSITVSRPGGLL